ncbi:MAG: RNA polymerase sigma factor [Pyrinomonadaceae bacterium]
MSGEEELIKRAQAGETEAFCLLAKAHERRIYSLALHYCSHPQDAEDLSQEVWLKAFAAISTFRYQSSFYTWLRKITIHCFLNHQRTRTFQDRGHTTNVHLLNVDSFELPDRRLSANLESVLNNRVLVEEVMQALSKLSPQQRLVFLLKHCEGMTYVEIAEAVGSSTGTVKKSLFRAITKLREHLIASVAANDCVACAPLGTLNEIQECH